MDDLAGIAEGHFNKIECFDRSWGKKAFNMTETADYILQALGLALVVMDRDAAMDLAERGVVRDITINSKGDETPVVSETISWAVKYLPD